MKKADDNEEQTLPTRRKRLSREEILTYIRRITSVSDGGGRPAVVRELYSPTDLALVTETPPRMIVPLVRMKVLLAATDPERTRSLIEIFIEEFDKRMISFKRKGRLEMLGALQAIAEADGQEEVPLA